MRQLVCGARAMRCAWKVVHCLLWWAAAARQAVRPLKDSMGAAPHSLKPANALHVGAKDVGGGGGKAGGKAGAVGLMAQNCCSKGWPSSRACECAYKTCMLCAISPTFHHWIILAQIVLLRHYGSRAFFRTSGAGRFLLLLGWDAAALGMFFRRSKRLHCFNW